MAHVHRRSFHEPDIAINAPARIPARRVRRIIKANCESVISAVIDIGSEVQFEGSVAIGPAAYKIAVEPNSRVGHRSVNVQIELLAFVLRRNREVFSIPTDAPPRKFPSLTRIFLFERTFDAPVVRQIQFSPTTIIKVALSVR